MSLYHATLESQPPTGGTFDYLATFSSTAQRDTGGLAAQRLDPSTVRADIRFRLIVAFLRRPHERYLPAGSCSKTGRSSGNGSPTPSAEPRAIFRGARRTDHAVRPRVSLRGHHEGEVGG